MCHADGLAAAHSGQDDDPHMAQQLPCVCVGGHRVVVLRAGGLHVLPAPLRRVHRLAKYVAEKLAKTLQVIVAIEAAHDKRAAIERPGLAQCCAPVDRLPIGGGARHMHGHLPGQAQQAAQRPGAAHCARLLQHLQAAFGQRVCGLPMGDLHLCLLQLLLSVLQLDPGRL